MSRNRRTTTDQVNELKAENAQLKADLEKCMAAMASAKANNEIISTLVNNLKNKLVEHFPTLA